jgi:hypothetical protein
MKVAIVVDWQNLALVTFLYYGIIKYQFYYFFINLQTRNR